MAKTGQRALMLIADFASNANWGNELAAQLQSMATPLLEVLRHDFSNRALTEPVLHLGSFEAKPDLLFLVLGKEARPSAPNIVRTFLSQRWCPPIVVVPGSEDPSGISELCQLGASDYLLPPFRSGDVHPRVRRLLSHSPESQSSVAVLKETLGLKHIIGESAVLMEQVRRIPQIARRNATVLITGETGTGKEVCARAIHYLSPRAKQPFVPLNCGAIPSELLENELFGHAPGAFTSANGSQCGLIRNAEGGTLLLDEVDALPLAAQVKLLRFLQGKEYRPLGARQSQYADVRIIAATNGDIESLVSSGKMRRDLFYRLNVLKLHLPPLRQRREDIPALARHFLLKYAKEFEVRTNVIESRALQKLALHDWPGNVRELENVIECAVAHSTTPVIESSDIEFPMVSPSEAEVVSFASGKAKAVAEFERQYLCILLEQHGGNIAHAAKSAQKNRRAFFQLMRKHQIQVERRAPSTAKVVKVVTVMDKNVHATNLTFH